MQTQVKNFFKKILLSLERHVVPGNINRMEIVQVAHLKTSQISDGDSDLAAHRPARGLPRALRKTRLHFMMSPNLTNASPKINLTCGAVFTLCSFPFCAQGLANESSNHSYGSLGSSSDKESEVKTHTLTRTEIYVAVFCARPTCLSYLYRRSLLSSPCRTLI